MHPFIDHEIAKSRQADVIDQAHRSRLAAAARRAARAAKRRVRAARHPSAPPERPGMIIALPGRATDRDAA
jgi:hypothetical protein